MAFDDMSFSVVDLAYQIINMDHELRMLRKENAELKQYREDYRNLLNKNIKHNEQMVGNIFSMLLTPGAGDAFMNNDKPEIPNRREKPTLKSTS